MIFSIEYIKGLLPNHYDIEKNATDNSFTIKQKMQSNSSKIKLEIEGNFSDGTLLLKASLLDVFPLDSKDILTNYIDNFNSTDEKLKLQLIIQDQIYVCSIKAFRPDQNGELLQNELPSLVLTFINEVPGLLQILNVNHFLYIASVSKNSELTLEKSFTLVLRCMNSMGFLHTKKCKIFYLPETMNLALVAINSQEYQDSECSDWEVFPVLIEVKATGAVLKTKLCKNKKPLIYKQKHTEALENLCNEVNLHLSRGKFIIEYKKRGVEFNVQIVFLGLEDYEIIDAILDTFGYAVHVFKHYATYFFNCITEINVSPILNHVVGEHRLFSLNQNSVQDISFCIPKKFTTIYYDSTETFAQEKITIERFKKDSTDFNHVYIDESKFMIKYPVIESQNFLKDPHKKFKKLNDFINEANNKGIMIKDLQHIHIAKVNNRSIVYIPPPFFEKCLISQELNSEDKISQLSDLVRITRRAQSQNINRVNTSDFDSLDFQNKQGVMLGELVSLEPFVEGMEETVRHYGMYESHNSQFLVVDRILDEILYRY